VLGLPVIDRNSLSECWRKIDVFVPEVVLKYLGEEILLVEITRVGNFCLQITPTEVDAIKTNTAMLNVVSLQVIKTLKQLKFKY
jgi:hypothetical protein